MNNSKGFTFIELLITLTLLAIAIVPVFNMFSGVLEQTRLSNDMTTARYLAQEGMEKVKNAGYTIAQLEKAGNVWEPPLDEPPLVIDQQGWRFQRQVIPRRNWPLEVHIKVFKEREGARSDPIVDFVTLVEDFEWGLTEI